MFSLQEVTEEYGYTLLICQLLLQQKIFESKL